MGSFWEQPLQPSYMAELFEKEASALLSDLAALPRNNTTAKLNDVVTRLRLVRAQALVFHTLRSEMPKMTGKDKKQRELITNLEDIFLKVSRSHSIPWGDFPDVAKFRHTLATHEACRDFTKFKKLDEKLLPQLEAVMRDHIGALMTEFESIPAAAVASVPPINSAAASSGGAESAAADPWASQGGSVAPPVASAPSPTPMPPAPPPAPPVDPWGASSEPQAAKASPTVRSDPWGSSSGGGTAAPPPLTSKNTVVDGLFGKPAPPSEPRAVSTQPPEPTSAAPPPSAACGSGASTCGASAEHAKGALSVAWAVSPSEKAKFDSIFSQMHPEGGVVGGDKASPRRYVPNCVLVAPELESMRTPQPSPPSYFCVLRSTNQP